MDNKEKQFQVKIGFDKPDSSPFGGVSFANTTLLVGEGIKNTILDHFNKQDSVISIQLGEGLVRHVNSRNILYIDVTEIKEKENN